MKTSTKENGAAAAVPWPIKNILVPIDFSEMSIDTIPTAQKFAERVGARLHLFHVQPYTYSPAIWSVGGPGPMSPAIDFEELAEAARRKVQDLRLEYRITGTCETEIGSAPWDLICWQARRIAADLIITPTHGRTGLARTFLGSTAERLVQHSPCPVLVARGSQARRKTKAFSIGKILVPVDFSECSLGGLRYGIQLAERFAARILIVHVLDLRPIVMADGYAMYDLSEYEESACAETKKEIRQFLQPVRFGSVAHDLEVISGPPVDALCLTAEKRKVDLIVTSTHGRTGFRHVLVGSTAELLARHAPTPVLVVPSHPAQRLRHIAARPSPAQRPSPARPKAIQTRPVKRSRLKHSNPERRLTNKFRESHARSAAGQ